MPSSQVFSDVSPGSLFAEVSPTGQYIELLTSSAGVAPTNEARIRLNAGQLEASINGGAYAVLATGTGVAVGGAISGGTDTRVLFDDNGVIGEDAGLVYNKTTNILTAGGVLTGAGAAGAPALAVGELTTGLYQTGTGATSELGFSLNGAATPQLLLKQTGVSSFSGTCEATIFSASSRLQTSLSTSLAVYAYGAASGAQVGSSGYDVHTAGICSVGPSIATGVAIGPGAVGTTGTPTTALITQAVHTGGASTIFKVTGAAIIGQTAATEASDVVWDLSRTVQFATGALTLQRQVVFDIQTTLAFAGTSVLTNCVGMHITAGPTRGNNAVITSTIGVYIGAVAAGTAATTNIISAAGARFTQMGFSADTVNFVGGVAVTSATAPISSLTLSALTVTGDTATCVVATAATLYISAAPIQGANVTLTKTYSLFIDGGTPRIDSVSANNGVGCVFTANAGPTGANTAIQEWLTIDINGTTRYIPCW